MIRRARAAEGAGDLAAAVEARQAAAEALRRAGGGQDLGRVLYDLAGTLLDRRRPDDAVAALDEAEQAYGGQFPGRVADVQARRAVAYGLAGAGASAVVDAQSAVLHHRGGRRQDLARAPDHRDGTRPDLAQALDHRDGTRRHLAGVLHHRDGRRRDLARALAVNADVLAAYGDPDLAVASADLAVRLFLAGRTVRGADRAELHRALAVAVAVHTAHGRPNLARQAAAVARRAAPGAGGGGATVPGGSAMVPGGSATVPGGSATVLGGSGTVPGGSGTVLGGSGTAVGVTVAAALEAARERLGREPPRIADRAVVRPAVDLELVVPLDRVATADAAARLGRTLARLATELLPLDGPAGARLGLEAHALLAGAARLGSELLADQLPAFGPPWAAALLACSRRAQMSADPGLALDLAAWAAGVAGQLFPAALVDRRTRAVATEALHHHGALATALRSPPR